MPYLIKYLLVIYLITKPATYVKFLLVWIFQFKDKIYSVKNN